MFPYKCLYKTLTHKYPQLHWNKFKFYLLDSKSKYGVNASTVTCCVEVPGSAANSVEVPGSVAISVEVTGSAANSVEVPGSAAHKLANRAWEYMSSWVYTLIIYSNHIYSYSQSFTPTDIVKYCETSNYIL